MLKRILSMALAAMMVLAVVGCGKEKRQPIKLTLSTEDSEAILRAAGIMLPDAESAPGANTVVKYFSWVDYLQNYSEDEIVNTGYFTFQEKYGGSIEWIETTYEDKSNDLANLLLAGTPPDCTLTGTSNFAVFPMDCIKGQYQPVDQWIDYTDPLWADMADAAEYFALGGGHFSIVTDLTYKDVVPYNRRVIEEWGFDDPAELYANDEWTWDVFYEMCMEFSDGDENRYALDGYAYAGALVESTGQQMLQVDENGVFYSNLDSPEIERAQNLIYDLAKNDCKYHEGTSMWALRNNATFGAGVKDGLCLFYVIGISFFTDTVEEVSALWGDIEAGELMFAPLPRDPQGDGVYYECSTISAYGMVKDCKNPDGVALLAACNRFKIVDPTVVRIDRKQLEEVYKWNQEMLEMWDTCREIALANQRIDLTGNLPDGLQNTINNLGNGIIRNTTPSTWAQLKEQNQESFDYYIDELNSLISEGV